MSKKAKKLIVAAVVGTAAVVGVIATFCSGKEIVRRKWASFETKLE